MAQVIYVNSGKDIYSFNPATCEYTFVLKTYRGYLDISFDRDGNLYGSNNGFEKINMATGGYTVLANLNDAINGLTISADDIAYMAGSAGELISYNLNTNVTTYHGNMGYGCAGDFTFYKGQLYMAALDNKIIKVNIDNPELSEVVLTHTSMFDIIGIVSDYRGCDDTHVYAISSEIFLMDLENLTFEFVCDVPIYIAGGASTSEFLASIPITLGTPQVVPPDCQSLFGSVSFPDASGMGDVTLKIDDSEWQTESYFGDLEAGLYSFVLKDENGCLDSIQIELEPYPLLIIDEILVTPASCNQADGGFSVSVSGGTGVKTYSLDGVLFLLSSHFTGLTAGTYTVYIKDNSGCIISQTVEVENSELSGFELYDVLDATCNQDNGAIFLYQDEMDPEKYMFSFNGGPFKGEQLIEGLTPGVYPIVVKHQDGCLDTFDITVESFPSPDMTLLASAPEFCGQHNGFIELKVINGNPPYKFRLNQGGWQTDPIFTQVKQGSYDVYVTDGLGCLDSLEVAIGSVDGPQVLSLMTDPATCKSADGRIQIEWLPEDALMTVLDEKMNPADNLDQLEQGDYRIIITDTAGCSLDSMVTISALGCTFSIPNIFSPNGDEINDDFIVELNPEDAQGIVSLAIYDRWGSQVFNTQNSSAFHKKVVWEGTFRGKYCPPGVYTYHLILMENASAPRHVFGDVTLVR